MCVCVLRGGELKLPNGLSQKHKKIQEYEATAIIHGRVSHSDNISIV